jgi:hypothetical protein
VSCRSPVPVRARRVGWAAVAQPCAETRPAGRGGGAGREEGLSAGLTAALRTAAGTQPRSPPAACSPGAADAFGGTEAVCYLRAHASLQASTTNVRRYARVALSDLECGYCNHRDRAPSANSRR